MIAAGEVPEEETLDLGQRGGGVCAFGRAVCVWRGIKCVPPIGPKAGLSRPTGGRSCHTRCSGRVLAAGGLVRARLATQRVAVAQLCVRGCGGSVESKVEVEVTLVSLDP